MVDETEIELPGEFEHRLALQFVKEGIARNNAFFQEAVEGLRNSELGDHEERTQLADFFECFGKNFARACEFHNSIVSMVIIAGLAPLSPTTTLQRPPMKVECYTANIPQAVIDDTGPISSDYKMMSVMTYHRSKFSIEQGDISVKEWLTRFYIKETEALEARELKGIQQLRFADRALYTRALGWTIIDMDLWKLEIDMETDPLRPIFFLYENLPAQEYYRVTSIALNLKGLTDIGNAIFDNQLHRHPRFRNTPSTPEAPETSKEMPVTSAKLPSRDIGEVVNLILAEIPQSDDSLTRSLLAELTDLSTSIPYTAPEALGMRWEQLSDIMNTTLVPADIVVNEWMAKIMGIYASKSPEEITEAAQRYIEAQNKPEVADE